MCRAPHACDFISHQMAQYRSSGHDPRRWTFHRGRQGSDKIVDCIALFVRGDDIAADGLVRIVKRKLKKIQYRPHLIDGCLTATGLELEPW
jgi:hypothetical protein